MTIWLAQNKKVSGSKFPKPIKAGLIQMDDDLINEYAIYAQDDGDDVN